MGNRKQWGDTQLSVTAPVLSTKARTKVTVRPSLVNTPNHVVAALVIVLPVLGVLAAAWLTWRHGAGAVELASCAIMYVLTFVGVEVGFHRHFAHRSFRAARPVRIILAGLGSMAFQGSVVWWAGLHRVHHAHADRTGDPHSPIDGFVHAHVGWLFRNIDPPDWRRRGADLFRDKVVRKATRTYYLWALAGLFVPALVVGLATYSWHSFLLVFLWAGLVRVFLVNHVIWGINSVCHTFGTRPYSTKDTSRNNVWMCLPSLGFSWHNNHHAFPGSALNAHRWWQFDPCGMLILGLQSVGLAWNVQRASGPGPAPAGADAAPPADAGASAAVPARPAGIRVLIITPDGSAVEKTRDLGAEILGLPHAQLMKTPLSPTGQWPATHWICKNYFPEEAVRKMASYPTRHGTEFIVGGELSTAQVLASRGLKRIRAEQAGA